MKKPQIGKEGIETLYDNKFLKLYGMHYENGPFYLQASRRPKDRLVALMDEDSYDSMIPDAVTIVLVINLPREEPKLYLEREYRYPAGHFLLSPPAGLIDPEDTVSGDPFIVSAKREIFEETGITVKDTDRIYVASPLFFSSPGMTDESNGIVCAVVDLPDLSSLSDKNAEGSECFDGYSLVTKEEAKKLVRDARDAEGHYFSIFTWAALLYFITEF